MVLQFKFPSLAFEAIGTLGLLLVQEDPALRGVAFLAAPASAQPPLPLTLL